MNRLATARPPAAGHPATTRHPATSRSARALLRVEDLTVSYGAVRALNGVSLSVPDGAVVALLGANGAGKSTTLRAISGIVRNDGGSIRFTGLRIDRHPPHAIARAGILHVPEGRGVFPSLTVRENLEVAPGRRHGTTLDGIHALGEWFPWILDRLSQPAGQLSGGEQQMLALARALISKPRLIMVDEISLGLAPLVVERLFAAIKEMARQQTTVLLVEQYVDMALDLASYAYVLHKGRVVSEGTPDELKSSGVIDAYLGTGDTT